MCGQKQREERERAGNGISYIKMRSTVLSVQENKTRACDSANHYNMPCKSAANHYSLPWKAAHFAAVWASELWASELASAHGKKRAHFALRPAEGAAVGGGMPHRANQLPITTVSVWYVVCLHCAGIIMHLIGKKLQYKT